MNAKAILAGIGAALVARYVNPFGDMLVAQAAQADATGVLPSRGGVLTTVALTLAFPIGVGYLAYRVVRK